MARNRHYAWALKFVSGTPELAWLSPDGRAGLDYARKLALNARERSELALGGGPLPAPLTIAGLADECASPETIDAQLRQARIDLFGKDLCDSAIYYRLPRRRERHGRFCAEEGCANQLARYATGGKRYCFEHGSGAARVRRHRSGRVDPS